MDNIPQEGGLSLQEIYAKTIDSVVSISCTLRGGSATGTGIVLTSDGYIVTNAHVVEGAVAISVLFSDDQTLDAQVVGSDTISDLAVLKVSATGLQAAQFADSTELRVGDAVVAIGDPLGIEYRGTMTDGIISALNRNVTVENRTMTLIQTNAALNSGNSGGPLLNCYGQVIGINTMKVGAGTEGLGFAIPSVTVKEIVDQLISQGYVSGRPDLGVMVESLPFYYRQIWGLPACVYVTEVEEGSTAADVGIVSGDVILSVDGVQVTDANTLETILYGYSAGDTIELRVFRDQTTYRVTVTLKEAKN
jgi:serine protease Do